MKTMTLAAALFAALVGSAAASSPAIITDAGSNAKYFGSTVNEVSTETGPVAGKPNLFRNGGASDSGAK